jgi:predicted nucleic-acid-binding Zn-ribbon protein
MKRSERCPKCDGHVIGVFPTAQMFVGAREGATGSRFDGCKMFGLVAYACGECGYLEHYLRRVEAEREIPLAEADVEFEWVRPPPPREGPFR